MDNHNQVLLSEKISVNIFSSNRKNKGERIHTFLIEKEDASFLKLFFNDINLPDKTHIEFQYKNTVQREIFHNNTNPIITIPSNSVNIRVILPKKSNLSENLSFELKTIEYDNNQRVIIGEDERRPYKCYEGTEIAEHSLCSAALRVGGYGSGSLIGDKNHVLTNRHVVISDPALVNGEIWFNWFNLSCDPASPINEPVRLKPGHVITMGEAGTSDNDYALFTLDSFDYKNSNVKTLFGGLEFSLNNPYEEEPIYIPQYGNGGLRPMYIGDKKNGEYAKILRIENNGERITYNADTQGGSSGSPVISRNSNKLVGLHWGGGNVNIGVSAQKLNEQLGQFIEGSNFTVIGLGKVSSYNLELTPISAHEISLPIDLGSEGSLIPFNTVTVYDRDEYSIIETEAIDLISNETFLLKLKAALIGDGYETNINDKYITGETLLRLYDFDIEHDRLIKFWVTFKVSTPSHNLKNYVIRAVMDNYDIYHPPFEIGNAKLIEFNFSESQNHSVSYIIQEHDNYGFVALYRDMGPLSLVWAESGYSRVKTLLKNASGDEVLVDLRGTRETGCSSRTMNSATSCASSNKFSRLVLRYYPQDNENLVLEKGDYEGIIPLQARNWGGEETENILIKVNLSH